MAANVSRLWAMQACPYGTNELSGFANDLADSGGTSWLKTSAPVVGGEIITLRFTIWDTSDSILDSSVLLDNFVWLIEPTGVGTIQDP